MRECLQKDDLHVDSDKYATQISICLAYMDRFRNWDNYVDLPEYTSWEKHGLNFSEKATKEYRKSISCQCRNSVRQFSIEETDRRMRGIYQ